MVCTYNNLNPSTFKDARITYSKIFHVNKHLRLRSFNSNKHGNDVLFLLADTTEVLNLLCAPVCGTTPLHDAVGNNHQQVVELLVRTGGQ